MSQQATDGVAEYQFVSRRTLVVRRFLRNRLAVVALVVLGLLFVGCYALPPLLPYTYSQLDYQALQHPPTTTHWFGTNALGQDL
nr:peptide ABC transporter permease [Actinomycetes bacterium]